MHDYTFFSRSKKSSQLKSIWMCMRTYVRTLRACVSVCEREQQHMCCHCPMNGTQFHGFLHTNSVYNTNFCGQLHANEQIEFKFKCHLCASISNTGAKIQCKKNLFKLHVNVTARVEYRGVSCFRFYSRNNKQQILFQVTLH